MVFVIKCTNFVSAPNKGYFSLKLDTVQRMGGAGKKGRIS